MLNGTSRTQRVLIDSEMQLQSLINVHVKIAGAAYKRSYSTPRARNRSMSRTTLEYIRESDTSSSHRYNSLVMFLSQCLFELHLHTKRTKPNTLFTMALLASQPATCINAVQCELTKWNPRLEFDDHGHVESGHVKDENSNTEECDTG